MRRLSAFIDLAVIRDVFTRSMRGWHLGRRLEPELTLTALARARRHRQRRPEIHHSDQGLQYAATADTDWLKQNEIKIRMADVGHAEQNGYAERLIRTIKEEAVYWSDYADYEDAWQPIGRFLDEVDLPKRIHSSLGYLTPAALEQQWRRSQKNG